MGNVIDPFEVIELLGADALRFYLMREVQWGQDGDVTWEGLHRRYEGELANDLGNLVSRATAMIVRYREGRVPEGRNALEPVHESVAARLDAVDLSGALGGDLDAGAVGQPLRGGAAALGAGQVGRARAGAGARRRALHAGGHGAVAGRDAVSVHPGLRREDPGGRRRPRRHRRGSGPRWGRSRPAARCTSPSRCSRASRSDRHPRAPRALRAGPGRRGGRGCRRRRRAHPHDRPRAGGRAGRPPSRRVGDRRLAPARGRRGRRRGRAAAAGPSAGWSRWARSASTSTATTPRPTISAACSPRRSSWQTSWACRS